MSLQKEWLTNISKCITVSSIAMPDVFFSLMKLLWQCLENICLNLKSSSKLLFFFFFFSLCLYAQCCFWVDWRGWVFLSLREVAFCSLLLKGTCNWWEICGSSKLGSPENCIKQNKAVFPVTGVALHFVTTSSLFGIKIFACTQQCV